MIKKVIETSLDSRSVPIKTETSADVLFMSGALQAAQNSSPAIRRKILSDVQRFANISAGEIEFMFALDNNNNDNGAFDMPDAGRRRNIILANNLDAAE